MSQKIFNGRYEIGEMIGTGGMADVYIAEDSRLHRKVAVKILRSDLARDPAFIARFKKEALAAGGLTNAGIVAVYDSGEDHGESYIVMELVNGRTLRELLQSNKPKGHKKGGKIVKMNEGGISPASDIPQTPAKQNPNTTDYVKPKTVDPGFREIFERVRNTPKPSGGVGYVPGTTNPFNPDSPLNRKRGGHVNIDQMKLELAMRK